MNRRQPITEGHLDELFPRGRKDKCELVLRDEHGRIIAVEDVTRRDEEHVKPFLIRLKELGLAIKTFYIDHCEAYKNAIMEVYPHANIQHDYFHIIQNIWRKVWSYFVVHRREMKARSERVTTSWYQEKLKSLAKRLWEKRHLLFKSDENMTSQEREELTSILEEDKKMDRMRSFLLGVWHLFRDSRNEEEARKALEELKRVKIEPKASEALEKVYSFLGDNFDRMITYLKVPGVKRNSLSESGMRVLRRLEVEHDGFRSPKGRQNCIKIYQAVKYLGWSVHHPPPLISAS
jgi:transposase